MPNNITMEEYLDRAVADMDKLLDQHAIDIDPANKQGQFEVELSVKIVQAAFTAISAYLREHPDSKDMPLHSVTTGVTNGVGNILGNVAMLVNCPRHLGLDAAEVYSVLLSRTNPTLFRQQMMNNMPSHPNDFSQLYQSDLSNGASMVVEKGTEDND